MARSRCPGSGAIQGARHAGVLHGPGAHPNNGRVDLSRTHVCVCMYTSVHLRRLPRHCTEDVELLRVEEERERSLEIPLVFGDTDDPVARKAGAYALFRAEDDPPYRGHCPPSRQDQPDIVRRREQIALNRFTVGTSKFTLPSPNVPSSGFDQSCFVCGTSTNSLIRVHPLPARPDHLMQCASRPMDGISLLAPRMGCYTSRGTSSVSMVGCSLRTSLNASPSTTSFVTCAGTGTRTGSRSGRYVPATLGPCAPLV